MSNKNYNYPLLLSDFYEYLMNYLSISLSNNDIFLYPIKADKDTEISLFFHKLNFLDVNFAKLDTSHTGNTLDDSNINAAETWQLNMTVSDGYFMDYSVEYSIGYKIKHEERLKELTEKHEKIIKFLNRFRVNTQIYTKLKEASQYGSTIDECCLNKFKNKLMTSENTTEILDLLRIVILLKVIPEETYYSEKFTKLVIDFLKRNDTDLINYCRFFDMVYSLKEYNNLFSDKLYDNLFVIILQKILEINTINSNDAEDIIVSIKNVFSCILNNYDKQYELSQILEILHHRMSYNLKSFQVYGGISGILYSLNKITTETILSTFNSIVLDKNARTNMVEYLNGLFSTVRDLFILEPKFLAEINNLFLKLDEMEFLEILPLLRLAFTFFPPYEIAQIAQNVANSLGTDINDIESRVKVDNEQEVIKGKILNNLAKEYLEKYKLLES